jgi:uncharacterized delta-60 repeat protein
MRRVKKSTVTVLRLGYGPLRSEMTRMTGTTGQEATPTRSRHGRRAVALACGLVLALVPAHAAQARLGDLDPAFDGDGFAVPDVGAPTAALRAALLRPDGSIVAAGRAVNGSTAQNELLVLQLTPEGKLDTTFNGTGAIRYLPFGEDGEVAALALAPGGDILAAGAASAGSIATTPRPHLVRISPSGVRTEIPLSLPTALNPAALTGVAALPDGRIVLGGWAAISGHEVFFAGRLTPGGAPDPTFNGDGNADGFVVADFGAGIPARAAALALDATGALTLAGVAAALPTQAAVARFTSTGALDPNFDGDGRLSIGYAPPFAGDSRFLGAATPGAGILVTGSLANGSQGVLQRLGMDGSLDPAHGSPDAPPGAAVWQSGPQNAGEAVAARSGGGAVVAGRTGTGNGAALQTGWFTTSGALDAAGGGLRTHPIELPGAGPAVGLALGAGEALVVAGTTAQQQPFVARFAPNAAPAAALTGPAQVLAGAPAAFDAAGSSDPEGEQLSYAFDLDGDGSYEFDGGTNPLALRSFPAPGGYTVGVRVTDPRGASATAARGIEVVAAPVPPPQPVLGEQGVAQLLRGIVLYRLPGTKKFLPLGDLTAIPNGTEIDARKGRVLITVLHDASGLLDGARFFAGRFIFSQGEGETPITTLRLSGGSFKNCTVGASVLAVAASVKGGTGTRSSRRVRRLWGSGRGRFRTRGRYGAATVRGTKWLTLDRCDGTLVRVVRGKVSVQDLVRANRRAKLVGAGEKTFVPYKRGG